MPDAGRDAIRFHGDEIMPEVDGITFGVVGDKDDTARGGKGESLRGEGGKEGLEGLHDESEMGRGCW